MAPLIPEIQQLIATTGVVIMVPMLAISVAALLNRQLGWWVGK